MQPYCLCYSRFFNICINFFIILKYSSQKLLVLKWNSAHSCITRYMICVCVCVCGIRTHNKMAQCVCRLCGRVTMRTRVLCYWTVFCRPSESYVWVCSATTQLGGPHLLSADDLAAWNVVRNLRFPVPVRNPTVLGSDATFSGRNVQLFGRYMLPPSWQHKKALRIVRMSSIAWCLLNSNKNLSSSNHCRNI